MKPTLQFAFACAVIALGAGRAEGQAVDTTAKGPEPTAAMLTPAMLDAGRKVFHGRGSCFACHGDKLQGGPVAPALTGPKWRHINGSFDAIIDRIDNGLPGTLMVAHPGGITESQIFMVAAYIYAVSHQLAKP